MANSLTNQAWKKIFDELSLRNHIENEGYVKVTAQQIKDISNREPRLMCKFDDTFSRPELFKDNDLSILPVKNGEYILFCGSGYCKLPKINQSLEFLEWPFKKRLETLPKEPRSESQVIDISYATQILHHFLHEDSLTLTIRGRLRTQPFKFMLETDVNSGLFEQ